MRLECDRARQAMAWSHGAHHWANRAHHHGLCEELSLALAHTGIPTPKGFEPLRAEPNGFRVHLLNRSDTLSWLVVDHACLESKHKDSSHEVERLPAPEASGARVCSCRSCAEKWQFWAGREVGQGFSCLKRARRLGLEQATARGFEPLRAEPNGFRVHLLNRSDTLSW